MKMSNVVSNATINVAKWSSFLHFSPLHSFKDKVQDLLLETNSR